MNLLFGTRLKEGALTPPPPKLPPLAVRRRAGPGREPPLHNARLSDLIKPKMNHLESVPPCKPGICVFVVSSLPGSARGMLDDTKINIHLSRLSNLTVFTV